MKVTDTEPDQSGRYRKIRTLGAGGMGVVYLAEDSRLRREVALKQLRSDIASDSANVRIQSEARLLASLNHPNIVQLYDVFEQEGSLALVMEYVEGPTLKRWMREQNPNLLQKIELLIQICRGLGAAHKLGIVHRDLKPDNILLSASGTAKIADFGIAKSLRYDGDKLTREGHVAGSIGTMSPEQLQGNSPDPRSDLFSLGVLAYQLLCEHTPFGEGKSPFETAERIVREAHPPATRFKPDLPHSLCRLLDQLLAKSPDKRPRSAAVVCAELEAIARSVKRNTAVAPATLTVTADNLIPVKSRPGLGRRGIVAGLALLLALTALTLLPRWLQNTEGKYIAVLVPTDSGQGDEQRILIHSTLSAIRHSLSNRSGLHLVPYAESQALRSQSLVHQAQALSVQLLLRPSFNCRAKRCQLTMELIDAGQLSTVARETVPLSKDNMVGGVEHIQQGINDLLPDYPPRKRDPNPRISREDYQRFLELESHSLDYRTIEVTPETLRALEELQRKAPRFPPLYDLYSRLAFDNRFTNRSMDSIERLEEFLDRAPQEIANSAELLAARFFLANARYDWKASAEYLAKLKPAMADSARYYYLETLFHHMRGDYELALQAIDRSLGLRTSTTYLMQKALTLSYAGEMQAARPYLQRIIELDSNYLDATALLAANELDMGNIDETVRLLEQVAPGRLSALDTFNLCTAHYLNGSFQKADQCFAELYTSLPDDLEPLIYRAAIARELGEPERALALAEQVRVLSLEREGWENQLILALAYAQLRRPEDAVATLMKIRQQATDDIYVNHAQAQVYITTDDLASAKAHVRRTLELGQSPVWYRTLRFAKLCRHPAFADLRADYPALCRNRPELAVTQK